jgi:hypothetical protein
MLNPTSLRATTCCEHGRPSPEAIPGHPIRGLIRRSRRPFIKLAPLSLRVTVQGSPHPWSMPQCSNGSSAMGGLLSFAGARANGEVAPVTAERAIPSAEAEWPRSIESRNLIIRLDAGLSAAYRDCPLHRPERSGYDRIWLQLQQR